MTHTTGPWTLEYDYSLVMGNYIVGRNFAPDSADASERQANARLIAAAPDLLAALIGISKAYERAIYNNPAQDSPDTEWLIHANAAIAKATGVDNQTTKS